METTQPSNERIIWDFQSEKEASLEQKALSITSIETIEFLIFSRGL